MAQTNRYICDVSTSSRMRAVASSNTSLEKRIRHVLNSLRVNFQANRRELPGCPDFVFPRRKKIIMVHGCFWHRHRNCPRASMPRKNMKLWALKFERTVRRDRRNLRDLKAAGWSVLILWECQLGDDRKLRAGIDAFLRNIRQTCPRRV